jgi:hypothetical protein
MKDILSLGLIRLYITAEVLNTLEWIILVYFFLWLESQVLGDGMAQLKI